jgi:hypothetical protein
LGKEDEGEGEEDNNTSLKLTKKEQKTLDSAKDEKDRASKLSKIIESKKASSQSINLGLAAVQVIYNTAALKKILSCLKMPESQYVGTQNYETVPRPKIKNLAINASAASLMNVVTDRVLESLISKACQSKNLFNRETLNIKDIITAITLTFEPEVANLFLNYMEIKYKENYEPQKSKKKKSAITSDNSEDKSSKDGDDSSSSSEDESSEESQEESKKNDKDGAEKSSTADKEKDYTSEPKDN